MKSTLIIFLLSISICTSAQIVSFDMLKRNQNTEVKLTLMDSESSEAISWASVYLIPDGDTTITHFALSDEKGDVLLKDVPVGKYELNAEMIGYIPHRKAYTIKAQWGGYDLGIIRMKENPEFLDAATVSAVGNPIVVKKDTIEFNASSFKVGENAMLEDLLKKMPGMEVGEDGSVTLNGEKIDKITVGGKTFFFDDPTAALKNLPAKIVDKIKVVDKTKDEASASGIVGRDDKEKVMDVELKDEFSKGWFGNAKLGGGSTLSPKDGNRLIDNRGLLYNSNAMATAYTEKDQFTFIGNAYNAVEPGAAIFSFNSSNNVERDFNSLSGLNSAAHTGLNYNTSRIKGMETTANVSYKHNGKQGFQRAARTTFQTESPDMLTESSNSSEGTHNSLQASLEIKSKENDRYVLIVRPRFGFDLEGISTADSSSSVSAGKMLNHSSSAVKSDSRKLYSNGFAYLGLKKVGKEKRTMGFILDYNIEGTDRKAHELSEVLAGESASLKDLRYDIDRSGHGISGAFIYSEPLADKWVTQLNISSRYRANTSSKDATNPDGSNNEYYSSYSDNLYVYNKGLAAIQYSNDTSTVQFGVTLDATLNEIKARSLGKDTYTGQGEWLMNWAPYASYQYKKNNTELYLGYFGNSNQPSMALISPTIDISNPVQISAGNIYLRPEHKHEIHAHFGRSDRETFSFLNISVSGTLSSRSIVYASWIDESGIRYAIPVNSLKPQTGANAYISYNQPLGKEKKFTLTTYGFASYTGNYSYQALSRLPGLDLQAFDYYSFMDEFWGDSLGERFYNGESGFGESRTNTLMWNVSLQLKYSIEKMDLILAGRSSNRISRYSLDPSANMNTWDNAISGNILYHPGKGWELSSDLSYQFYNGYSNGFGKPEWNWNMSISKSIKSISLGLKVADILNQTRSLQRTVSAEYMEDIYTNVLGRFFLFNISFNFGKMNAKKNSNVEGAMWQML